MSTTSIPGPRSAAYALSNPLTFANGTNSPHEFYLGLIASLNSDEDARSILGASANRFGGPKGDWTLSDMQEGVSTYFQTNIEMMINRSLETNWYFMLCPRTRTTSLQHRFVRVYFHPSHSQQAAPRNVARTNTIEQEISEVGLSRYINGDELDAETFLPGVNNGVEWLNMRITAVLVGIIETDKQMICAAIANSHLAQRVRLNDFINLLRRRNGIEQYLSVRAKMTFSVVKEVDPILFFKSVSNEDFNILGVPTSDVVTIIPEQALRMFAQNPFYRETRLGNMPQVTSLDTAAQLIGGERVFVTSAYMGRDGQIATPFSQTSHIGLWNLMPDLHDNHPDLPYMTDNRNVKITNAEHSTLSIVALLDALDQSGRWDPVTGDLISIAGMSDPNGIKAQVRPDENDAFHVRIDRPHFGDDSEPPYTGPATHWGSLSNKTVSSQKLQSCARTVIASFGADATRRINQAISTFLELVAEAGNQKVSGSSGKTWADPIDVALNEDGAERDPGIPGCKSTNPLLKFHKIDPSTRFAASVYGVGVTNKMPVGFGSLAAMRALFNKLSAAPNALSKRLELVIAGADELAGMLRDKFPASPLIDVNYASSDMAYADAADMLFASLIPRRAVVIVAKGSVNVKAAVDAAKTQTEDYLSAVDGFNIKEYDQDAPENSLMIYAALNNFAKNSAGVLVRSLPDGLKGLKRLGLKGIAFGEEIINRLKDSRGTGVFLKTAAELRETFRSIVESVAAKGAGPDAPVMTKLYLEPRQVIELANIIKKSGGAADEFPAVTIGSHDGHDVPMTKRGLAELAKETQDAASSMQDYFAPLSVRYPLTSAGSLHAIHAIGQLRAHMRANGYPVPRGTRNAPLQMSSRPISQAATTTNRRDMLINSLRAKAQPSAAARAGSSYGATSTADPTSAFRRFFGCIDHNIDLMLTDNFVRHWDECNQLCSSNLELLVARLYMTTPTNYRQSVRVWATNNVRIPLSVALVRTLRIRTLPVIRMLPGKQTMELYYGFEMMTQGTNQDTAMYFFNRSYYAGVVVHRPENIQVYADAVPYGYGGGSPEIPGGLGVTWYDHSTNRGDLKAVVLPGDQIRTIFSPYGDIELLDNGYDVTPHKSGSESIALFEQIRAGRINGPAPVVHDPLRMYGVAPHAYQHTLPFYRDTSIVAGANQQYDQYVPSASPIPTTFATSDLRAILDGQKRSPDVPYAPDSSKQFSMAVRPQMMI